MKDIFYLELKEKSKEISAITDETERKKGLEALAQLVDRFCGYCNTARMEGILGLEKYVDEEATDLMEKQIMRMVTMVCDGTDPEVVEQLSLARYFSLGLNGFEALIFLCSIVGTNCIIEKYNPRVVEDILLSYMPMEVEGMLECTRNLKTYDHEMEEIPASDEEVEIEKFFKGELLVGPEEKDYYLFAVTDHVLNTLGDSELNKLLSDIDRTCLIVAMKGLRGETRKRIFEALPERTALLAAKELDYLGPIRVADVAEAVDVILEYLIRMSSHGFIINPNMDIMSFFRDAYHNAKEEEKRAYEKNLREKGKLEELMKHYYENNLE
ncbi:MAG: hypothetical protein K5853_06660 [Lachnospiraceae bacterium]|nr:hypothetical protein [Lachnospiraceae bacterium]